MGNNSFEELPAVAGHLEPLKELSVFCKQITVAPPEAIGGFTLFCMISILEVFEMEKGGRRRPLRNLVVHCNECFKSSVPGPAVLNRLAVIHWASNKYCSMNKRHDFFLIK